MNRHLLGIVVALVVAAGLRLVGLEHMEWKSDERIHYDNACRIAVDGRPVADGGPTSVGWTMPTGLPHVLAWMWPSSGHPVELVRRIALCNVLALGLFAGWCWWQLGSRVALLTTWLGAVAPWPVLLSRKLWHPVFLPLVVALVLLMLSAYAREPRGWRQLWPSAALALVAVSGWVYPPSYLLVPPVLVAVWIARVGPHRLRSAVSAVAPGMVVVMAVLGSYLSGAGEMHLNPKSAPGRPGVHRTLHVARHTLEVVSGLSALDQLGADRGGAGRAAALAEGVASGLLALLALLGLGRGVARRAELDAGERVLLGLSVGLLVVFGLLGFVSQRHYGLLLLLPLLAWAGLGAARVRWRWLGGAAVLAIVLCHGWVDLEFGRNLVRAAGVTDGAYGTAFSAQVDPLQGLRRCVGRADRSR